MKQAQLEAFCDTYAELAVGVSSVLENWGELDAEQKKKLKVALRDVFRLRVAVKEDATLVSWCKDFDADFSGRAFELEEKLGFTLDDYLSGRLE